MKYLKIKNNKGFFRTEDDLSWKEIDQITKSDLMKLLDQAIKESFEMDLYEEDKIGHKAHAIVYRNLHEKLEELISNRSQFKDEIDNLYKDAIKKYSQEDSD